MKKKDIECLDVSVKGPALSPGVHYIFEVLTPYQYFKLFVTTEMQQIMVFDTVYVLVKT